MKMYLENQIILPNKSLYLSWLKIHLCLLPIFFVTFVGMLLPLTVSEIAGNQWKWNGKSHLSHADMHTRDTQFCVCLLIVKPLLCRVSCLSTVLSVKEILYNSTYLTSTVSLLLQITAQSGQIK